MAGTVYLFMNIGTGELMLILFVALLLFGGDKLPGIARTVGRGIRDFKNASEDVKREINNQINSFDEKRERKNTPALTAEDHTAKAPDENDEERNEHPDITENLNASNHVDSTDVAVSNDTEQQEANKPDFTKPANTVEYKG
ncbi:twin-arginine translocase TatA/TatE family subunit [Mucilaginibacter hurinus]|uniref:Sec-independent protein translocase protein TatA n=1 Tax=Mucilaginibacter hurinus TaxID=2201324 RepID=A0A367GMG4_9SPHI|nr:twin-arginine translocase TatA/TatE family subunit [Mucilaginibacter hurinus]RCH54657.1 twin-arginine translocase TatA/TatE family subunit [Mucilaginibacter hurinus]